MFQHPGPHGNMDSCPLCSATSCLSLNITSSWKPSDFQVARAASYIVIVCLLSILLRRHQSQEPGLWVDKWTSEPIRECWVVRRTGNWGLGKTSVIGARGCNHLCSADEPRTAGGPIQTGNRDFLLTRGRGFGTGRECLLMVGSNAILIIAQVPHHSWCYDNAGLKKWVRPSSHVQFYPWKSLKSFINYYIPSSVYIALKFKNFWARCLFTCYISINPCLILQGC